MIEQIYQSICDTNDQIIGSKEKIATIIFFIKGDQSKAHTIHLDKKNKDYIQEQVKSMALKEGVDGYIVVVDSILKFVRDYGERKQYLKHDKNCVIRSLYTPTQKITELVAYKDGVIIDKKRILGRKNVADMWDAWNEVPFN